MYKIAFLFILLILFIPNNKVTNEGYQNNARPPDRPDDKQFYACHDYNPVEFEGDSIELKGNNNYKIIHNEIGIPLQGGYSHFLNTYELRNFEEIFHAPICEGQFNFNNVSSIESPSSLLMMENDQEILKLEADFDENNLKNPMYIYGNPKYIANKLIYNNEINELFLTNHRSRGDGQWISRLDDIYDQ